ncbi:MAG: acetyl-CoA acetyltransferase [Alphaproteobacteria bacterium]|jgi:acetyl-CoA C-acetyltransferase|nr:acetyl-CoA acetyltransferase [Alphaproteobacteria bacterium]
MIDPRTPVLIGAGQITYRKGSAPGPRGMVKDAAERAAEDAGLAPGALAGIDLLGVVGFTIDAGGPTGRLPIPRLANPPATLAEDLGAAPTRAVYAHMGGNTPQQLVNFAAEEIAAGRHDFVLLTGAEYLGTLLKRFKGGEDVAHFGGGAEGRPERFGDGRPGESRQEAAHGCEFPANVYPMFENAVRAHRGRSLDQHKMAMARLFSPFSAIAAKNPYAWFPTFRTPEAIAADGPDNRLVGFPYTKFMNAVIQVDQAAAVIICSSEKADALGAPKDRRIYLHGCGEATERWNLLDRVDYHSSPAIRTASREALKQAGLGIDDIALFDLYSCFPVAVELACQELGLREDDPRGLTVTGGLPYFGGPGNNYVMHSIAEMVWRLRDRPGDYGLVTANGMHLTKQAVGVYAAHPPKACFSRRPPKDYQTEIDELVSPETIAEPSGEATIETYTVIWGRDRVRMGIVIGRDAQGRRFVANTPPDEALLLDLQSREGVGRRGVVESFDGGMRNVFTPL